jgi:aldehyde dehydrogenase (NAD+)
VITAFNFPVAVWSQSALLAAVCGDCVIWKPSRETPLTAIAIHRICRRVLESHGWPGVFNLCVGPGEAIGEAMAADPRLPLVSFTGSTATGQQVAIQVAGRSGRTIFETGGNNGMIVMDDANLDLALAAIFSGAIGTAGQRCTTTRRLFLQRGIAPKLCDALAGAYKQVRIGDPLDAETGMGPLIHERAVQNMMRGLRVAKEQGCEVIYGGRRLSGCFAVSSNQPWFALIRACPFSRRRFWRRFCT